MGGWRKEVTGIRECTCDEHRVMFGIVHLELILRLHVNYIGIFFLKE